MAKKSVCWILIILLINYLIVSCVRTSDYKLVREEFTTTIASQKITGLVTVSGDRYKFMSPARYLEIPYMIKGVLANGKDYSMSLDNKQLREIRTSRAETVPAHQASGKNILEIIMNDYRGGRIPWQNLRWDYDFASNTLLARDESGIRFQTNADSIREIRITQPDTVSIAGLKANPEIPVTELKVGSNIYIFDQFAAHLEEDRGIIQGIAESKGSVEIDVNEVLYVMVEKADPAKTLFATIGGIAVVLAGAFLVLAITSCPFVYSFDGEKYVFDAEPLGGAVSKGLQMVDYSRLEHLKPVNGQYKLMFRNEMHETQYIDHIKLVAVDHDPGSEVINGIDGKYYQIDQRVSDGIFTDEKGRSLDLFLNKNDGLIWQTIMPGTGQSEFETDRHEVVMKFPVPEGVKSANLIFHGGTALWGSNMVREMLQLRGDKLDDWYSSINSFGSEYTKLIHFTLREELYVLNLYAQDGRDWRHMNYLGGGGPLITENRIIPLDLSWLHGDTLTLKINPPQGFWQIDYIALEYENTILTYLTELAMVQAVDQDGNNITDEMLDQDNEYHIMQEVGDWFEVEFNAPVSVDGKNRTVFLKTDGFYELHIDKTIPEQTQLVGEIMEIPGKIQKYSQKRFVEWTKDQESASRDH